MALTDTTGWVGDPDIVVTCATGYVLDSGQLHKNITCLPTQGNATWSDVLGSCERKQCPNIANLLGTNMHLNATVPNGSFYGDEVVVVCDMFFAFSVNYSVPKNVSRVSSEKGVRCIDTIESPVAEWEEIGNCTEIKCSMPPNVTNSVHEYSDVTINSTVLYKCLTGSTLSNGLYSFNATCDESAHWLTASGSRVKYLDCEGYYKYVGCVSSGSILDPITVAFIDNNREFCIPYCQSLNKGLAAVYNDTCMCADVLEKGFVVQSRADCTLTCPSYTGEPYQEVFCGGTLGQAAVYATQKGCFLMSSLIPSESEQIFGTKKLTCRERCRGKEYLYSAFQHPDMCHCFNDSQSTAVPAGGCKNGTNVAFFQTLAQSSLSARTCYDLYMEGIRMNGDYMVIGGKINCVFRDGTTACENGWIGYGGFCYYFNNQMLMNFDEARDFCISIGADLVSIATQGEFDFLQEARETHGDLWFDKKEFPTWYIGLIDKSSSLLYTWIDGSLMTFHRFFGTVESTSSTCASDSETLDYSWEESHCNSLHNVMCKKPAADDKCSRFSQVIANYTTSLETMSVTFCTQYCKGKAMKYAVFQATTCHCMNDLLYTSPANASECNLPCPGHSYQFCGGVNDVYSVIETSIMLSARSCKELNLYGIDDNVYHLQIDETTDGYEYCSATPCPYSWLELDGVCYKYSLLRVNIDEAIQVCAKEDAYMTTIEYPDEVDSLLSASLNISLYKDISQWRLGLFSLGENGGVFRWSNGKIFEPAYWNSRTVGSSSIVAALSSDPTRWYAKAVSNDITPFICEKGSDYVGCYSNVGLTTDVSVQNYDSMTIQQCVEICKASDRRYAYLNTSGCVCEDFLTNPKYGSCLSVCNGQRNQVCGGTNVLSVYDTVSGGYPMFSTCDELYDASIFMSRTYRLAGSLVNCTFKDETVCSESGWIGYQGHCYKHFIKGSDTNHVRCANNGAIQTSATSVDEFEFLKNYSRLVNLNGAASRIFTGITHGGYHMGVFISQEGFLTDQSTISLYRDTKKIDLNDKFWHMALYTDYVKTFTENGGTICKKDLYYLGCFEKPTTLSSVVERFWSVELGMCRQLCLYRDLEITLLGLDFCACATATEFHSFIATSVDECNIPCNLHTDQICGNGTVMLAYNTNSTLDISYAGSCQHLYSNGIFYNTTYLIRNENGTIAEKQCGYTDDTTCGATWLGKNGTCYNIIPHLSSFFMARFHCLLGDAYLFNPVHDWVNTFLTSFVTTSGLLSDSTIWLTGIEPVFYNVSFVMSSGHIVTVDHTTENKPVSATLLNITDMTWMDHNATITRPTICQRDPDYLGCNRIITAASAAYVDHHGNSLSQCMYWCKGSNFSYAAVHLLECLCFHQKPVMTSEYGKCDVVCDARESQMCGGLFNSTVKLYNVVNTSTVQDVDGSCQELFKHGIFKPGWYHIRTHTIPPLDVNVGCFNNPALFEYHYLTENVKSLTVSSTLDSHIVDHIKLIYPFTLAWKPATGDTNSVVKVVMDHSYIFTGFVTSGLHTSTEQSYIVSFRLQYRDLITGLLVTYTDSSGTELLSGCQATAVLCFHILEKPVVTNEIHILPVTWYHSVSLQLAFAGQNFSEFDHTETYIGCMIDPMWTFQSVGAAVDIHECRNQCSIVQKPYASLDISGTCMCGVGDFDYGFVQDSKCPVQNGRFGSGPYRAVHRTYHKHCGQMNESLAFGHVTNVDPPNLTPHIYPYMTRVQYQCDLGYEFVSGATYVETICLEDNTWSPLPENCSIISCPSFTVEHGNATIESLEYQGKATISCDRGYSTDTGHAVLQISCQHDKTWYHQPACRGGRKTYFRIHRGKIRISSNTIERTERSETSCAIGCSRLYSCKGASFQTFAENDGGVCRIFETEHMEGDLITDENGAYLEISNSE